MAAKRPRPSRDEVLSWMDETGSGPAAAGRHFGLKASTVRSWKKRNGATAQRRNDRSNNGKTVQDENPVPQPRAATPSKGARGRARGRRSVTLKREDLSSYSRDKLAETARNLMDFLASDTMTVLNKAGEAVEVSPDMRQKQAAAVTLGILVDKCPDILSFEQQLRGGDPEGGTLASPDAVERLRAIRQRAKSSRIEE